MKFKSILKASGLLASAALMGGCQADIDAPDLKTPHSSMESTISIAELKSTFNDVATVDKIGTMEDGSHYIVKGRVISCDASGNIYQTLVIQDNTAALDFSIGRASLYNIYPVGQEVVVDLTGLYIGKYGDMQRIGDYYESGGTAQPGRMLYPRFAEHSQLNGLPNLAMKYVKQDSEYPSENPYTIITTIDKVNSLAAGSDEINNMMSQLVEFNNVSFVNGGKLPFAEYQETNNRYIQDQMGNQLVVRNSGYSNFYQQTMPEGEGTVRGILSYYSGTWQLLLRSIDDVIFSDKGKRNDPYSIAEVLEADNNGMNAWITGYIVGTSKAGVSAIHSNADVVFGADGDINPSNLLLAATPDCREYSQCVAVELPQGSRLREYGNLLTNPENLGRKMMVTGEFSSYLGIHGLVGSAGGFSDFDIEGLEIDAPEGLGTEDMPYTCSYVLSHYEEAATAWVGGYIVGYVSGTDYATGLHFEQPEPTANGGNLNFVLAPEPGCTDPDLCIVVRTSSKREELGLANNPQLFGKYFKVEGQMGLYLKRAAVTTITNYAY